MLDVSFGVFTMMAIIAGMVIGILAARFVYIDKQYEKMIQKYKDIMDTLIEKLEEKYISGVNDEYRFTLEHALAYKDTIGKYKSQRDSNRQTGATLDIAVMITIIIIGLATVLEIFEINILLVSTLLVLAMMPVLHFGLHMRMLKEESQF